MPFPTTLLAPSTWRTLGLGLTTIYIALGALAIINPDAAAAYLGVLPTTREGREMADKGMIFLGIRDIAVGLMLGWFYAEGKTREMGVMTTAWTLVCVVDTWVAMQGPRGWDRGIGGLCVGAAVTAFVGLGMVQT